MAIMDLLTNNLVWIISTIFFGLFLIGIGILFFLLLRKTHLFSEIKAFFSGTPIGIFFQDNKFAEWKPITPINGIIYDENYGPFMVSTTYVDKKTKNIIIPFDVDMDGDRTSNIKELVEKFRNISNNEKSIVQLRSLISSGALEEDKAVKNISSFITYGSLKKVFLSSGPHSIKSKIEKIVAEKLMKYGQVNAMQAIIVFGAIFGIIVLSAIILKITGRA